MATDTRRVAAMMVRVMRMPLLGPDDERGTIRLMVLFRRLTIDVYTWPRWRWNCWSMWSVGVLGNLRVGRVECQARWAVPR